MNNGKRKNSLRHWEQIPDLSIAPLAICEQSKTKATARAVCAIGN
jgi:hypothetical protein